jgi:hypothetical protein
LSCPLNPDQTDIVCLIAENLALFSRKRLYGINAQPVGRIVSETEATQEGDQTEDTATDDREDVFAYARSNEASKFAYESCKVIAQSCLLINGGAATAVVALLSKDKVDQSILTWVPYGLGAYALGVVFSAVMLFCVMMMADQWNYAWYWWSYGDDEELAEQSETSAHHWHKGVYTFFVAPIFALRWDAELLLMVWQNLNRHQAARSRP